MLFCYTRMYWANSIFVCFSSKQCWGPLLYPVGLPVANCNKRRNNFQKFLEAVSLQLRDWVTGWATESDRVSFNHPVADFTINKMRLPRISNSSSREFFVCDDQFGRIIRHPLLHFDFKASWASRVLFDCEVHTLCRRRRPSLLWWFQWGFY